MIGDVGCVCAEAEAGMVSKCVIAWMGGKEASRSDLRVWSLRYTCDVISVSVRAERRFSIGLQYRHW